jgi:uncharacterized protein YodC (DUF2158 family)
MKFRLGSIVVLKSGGPDMTVASIGEDGVICVWFEGKRCTRKTFEPETLSRRPKAPKNITFKIAGRKLPGDPSK